MKRKPESAAFSRSSSSGRDSGVQRFRPGPAATEGHVLEGKELEFCLREIKAPKGK